METIYQSPLDLQLGVYQGTPYPPVTVLIAEAVAAGPYQVVFTIIGESHTVNIYRDGVLLVSEVLACISLDPTQCIHHHAFHDGQDHVWDSRRLTIVVQFVENEIPKPLYNHSLTFNFPLTYGVYPFTRVEWRIGPRSLQWRTIHVYPSPEGVTSVVSNSSFQFA